jgi:outer membrane biosynthesis protein TonB
VNAVIAEDQLAIHARLAEAREQVAKLEQSLCRLDAELEAMAAERRRYTLLGEICMLLDRLEESGGADMFWGDGAGVAQSAANLARMRDDVAQFSGKIARIEQKRDQVHTHILRQLEAADMLDDELAELKEEEERQKFEFVVEREFAEEPYRPMVMPWTGQREDETRFRKVLMLTLLLTLTMTALMSLWKITQPDKTEVAVIPEHLVRLVKKEPPPPQPLPPREERKVEQKEQKEQKQPDQETKTAAETPQAPKKAESPGLLAFKNTFTDLMELPSQPKLGVDARVSTDGQKAVGQQSERALLTAQAQARSGGIDTSNLSRDVGGLGNKVGGVEFARVESAIGAGAGGSDRPLSKGPGPSRTDEEIQIVFDRYKAALYRIYNRELRNDPTLSGKMVLRITIEPGGEVSFCQVESTNLGSRALVNEIVERVRKFNFGPKEGVPRVTILYPIDFLPASENGGSGNS